MKQALRFWVIVLLIAVLPLGAVGGRMDLLGMGVGSQATALGHASVARRGTLEGSFGNPASLAGLSHGWMILASVVPIFDLTLYTFAAATRSENGSVFAVSFRGLNYGSITGGQLDPTDLGRAIATGDQIWTASGSLALGSLLRLPFDLDLGCHAAFLSQVLDSVTLTGGTVDGGLLARFGRGKLQGSVGIHGQNLVRFGTQLSPPLRLKGGVGGGWQPIPQWHLDLLADGAWEDGAAEPEWAVGLESRLWDRFTLRVGCPLRGAEYGAPGLSFGAGIHLPVGGGRVGVDYAWLPLGGWSAGEQQIQLTIAFGPAEKATAEPQP